MAELLSSFAPLVSKNSRVLILGSMPGERSLQEQQYYAHPRNAFWRVMQELFAIDADLPYEQRCVALTQHGLALWDVLAQCTRKGSLDSAIDNDSIIINDFVSLFQDYPDIEFVFFNGGKAEQTFRRHVPEIVTDHIPAENLQRLPSTSPAHAAMSFADKLEQWSQITYCL